MKTILGIVRRWRDHGQSLVEVALFLPILIFILAGVVEVSNLLVTQNRVTTSSRIAAGFGATNFNPDEWAEVDPGTLACLSGTACAMGEVAINTVTETLDLSPELWDVWSIFAEFDNVGTGFNVFTYTHAYGSFDVISQIEWSQIITDVKSDMLTDLQGASAGTANLGVVAAIAYHDIGTILGLPVWQWTGLQTIRGMTVMRVDEKPPFMGCPIMPISIRIDQFSIYPTNWEEMDGKALSGQDPLRMKFFPPEDAWEYPDGKLTNPPAPTYTQTVTATGKSVVNSQNFIRNVPGVTLGFARPGYLYWARDIQNDEGLSGNMGWLSWQDEPPASALGESLTYPGDFVDPDPYDGDVQGYRGGRMDLGSGADCPGPLTGNGDGHLAIGEWVANAPGNMNANSINAALQWHVDEDIPMFLIVYDYTNQGEGPQDEPDSCDENAGESISFHVLDFAKVNLVGYQYTGLERWIVFEFLGWGLQCNAPDYS